MPTPWSALAEATPAQRRTLLAAALGWMLDAFDVMLYALVVSHIMRDLNMSKPVVGLLNTLMLLASGAGGLLFGVIADRIGRARALSLSILTYSIFSFASGLSQSILQLAVFRTFLGLGMGGEWNTGATLVAETWPSHLRARALSMVQSSWAIGYALAALVAGIMLRFANWRYVFFVGVLPALVTLSIQRRVPESEMWQASQSRAGRDTPSADPIARQQNSRTPTLWDIFRPPLLGHTVALLLVNFFGLFAWWGLFTWIPTLSFPSCRPGRARLRRALHHRPAAGA